ncbi:hypothetical protein GCM10027562_03920 [Arthrobacter pigmenti]
MKEQIRSTRIGSLGVRPAALGHPGYGAVFGIFNCGLVGYIETRKWDEAARLIAKAVGKSAIKGGVVGLTASLAASATWCAVPWA